MEEEKSGLQTEYDDQEYLLIQAMQEAGMTTCGISNCTASLKLEKYPKIDDMENFVQWCADNGQAGMLQKRVSKAVFDEFFNLNGEYPEGIDTYDKLTLGLRKR